MRYLALCLVFALPFGGPLCAQEDDSKPQARIYSDGPLTADDFQATPDDEQPYAAWTSIDMQFKYAYRYRQQNKQVMVTLTEIDVYCILEREKSWNRRPRDPLLMDHEQGHFDLTQIHALEAHTELRKGIGTEAGFTARGASEKQAAALLEQKLRDAVKVYSDRSQEANRQYDKETMNGIDVRAQALARRAQQQRLAELMKPADELAP